MWKKITLFLLISSILVFCGISVYSNFTRGELKQAFKKTGILQQDLRVEKNIKSNLEEKYRADLISYRVMVKRLELEKNKQKELKEKIIETGIKSK